MNAPGPSPGALHLSLNLNSGAFARAVTAPPSHTFPLMPNSPTPEAQPERAAERAEELSPPEQPVEVDSAALAIASKRTRSTKLETAQKRKRETLERIERKRAQISRLCVGGSLPASKARQVQGWEADIAQLERELVKHTATIDEIGAEQQRKAEVAAAKQKKAVAL